MKIQISTTSSSGVVRTVEVDKDVLKHMLTCHSSHLHKWEQDELDKFTKFMSGFPKKDDSERRLEWLHTEWTKINMHRETNDAVKNLINETI